MANESPALKYVGILIALTTICAGVLGVRSLAQTTVAPIPAPRLAPIAYKIFPPPEYDHDYDGDLTIHIMNTLEELHVACAPLKNPNLLACSWHNLRSCVIIMVKDELMRERGYTTGLMYRHERGHCNGWPGDHPGELPLYVGSTHWVPADLRVRWQPYRCCHDYGQR